MAYFCGLICPIPNKPAEPVPLKEVAVKAQVRGWSVGVTATLTYENDQDKPLEVQFVFPLADTAAIYSLEAEIAGRKIVGQVKERKTAQEDYKEAVDSGHAAALLESQVGSPDVFRCLLGNLPAKKLATVTIKYVQPLDREPGGILALNLPTVLNPRYVPAHQISSPEEMQKQFHAKVPYISVSQTPYEFKFETSIDLGGGDIADVTALGDKATVQYAEGKKHAKVTLGEKFKPDHDFRLLITPAEPWKPSIFVEHGQKGGDKKSWLSHSVGAAWYEPKQAEGGEGAGVAGDEYWLVIDRSGSMGGEKIENAKSALILFVKSLPIGCKFNIVGFGSTFIYLFPEGSVAYSEESIKKAVDHSKQLDADLGGTEILEPLKAIYSQPKPDFKAGARQFIVLLTDGEVSNTEEVIEIASKNMARVFTIGIGEGASTALVNGLARVSGGVAEFVRNDQDRLQPKVVSLLQACLNPAAEDIAVSWKNAVSTMPTQLPRSAYNGHPIKQFAILGDDAAQTVATFYAKVEGKPVDVTFSQSDIATFKSEEGDDAMPLHRLAAKSRLQELKDGRYRQGADPEAIEKESVQISLATGVLCDFTSLVAIDKEAGKVVEDKAVFFDVPVPSAYSMSFGGGCMLRGAPRMMMMCAKSAPRAAGGGGFLRNAKRAVGSLFGNARVAHEAVLTSSNIAPQVKDESESGSDMDCVDGGRVEEPFDQLVALQRFDGSWTDSPTLRGLISATATDEAAIRNAIKDDNVWETRKVSRPTETSAFRAAGEPLLLCVTAAVSINADMSIALVKTVDKTDKMKIKKQWPLSELRLADARHIQSSSTVVLSFNKAHMLLFERVELAEAFVSLLSKLTQQYLSNKPQFEGLDDRTVAGEAVASFNAATTDQSKQD